MNVADLYRGENVIRLAFFLGILASGVFVCGGAVQDFSNARASVSWPTVDGVVLEDRGRGVHYAYSWEGHNYEASRSRFLTGYEVMRRPEPTPLRSGAFVSVYVSPEHPVIAVLNPGGDRTTFAIILGFGAVLVFVGGGGLARSLTFASHYPEMMAYDISSANQHIYKD